MTRFFDDKQNDCRNTHFSTLDVTLHLKRLITFMFIPRFKKVLLSLIFILSPSSFESHIFLVDIKRVTNDGGTFCFFKKDMISFHVFHFECSFWVMTTLDKKRQVYPLIITHLTAFSLHNALVYGEELIDLFLIKYLIGRRKLLQKLIIDYLKECLFIFPFEITRCPDVSASIDVLRRLFLFLVLDSFSFGCVLFVDWNSFSRNCSCFRVCRVLWSCRIQSLFVSALSHASRLESQI